MLINNSLYSVQAESSTFSYSLRRKERFENVRLNVRRDSGAVVGDLNYNGIVLPISPNSQLALAAHGVDGVINDVRPNLIQFTSEGIHEKRNFPVVALHDT